MKPTISIGQWLRHRSTKLEILVSNQGMGTFFLFFFLLLLLHFFLFFNTFFLEYLLPPPPPFIFLFFLVFLTMQTNYTKTTNQSEFQTVGDLDLPFSIYHASKTISPFWKFNRNAACIYKQILFEWKTRSRNGVWSGLRYLTQLCESQF